MVGHMMLANKAPEFAMQEDEAIQLSTAICNYLKHTKVKINPKTEALWAMLVTVGMIEGTRVIAYTRRIAAEKASQKSNHQGNVFPIMPGERDPYAMPGS